MNAEERLRYKERETTLLPETSCEFETQNRDPQVGPQKNGRRLENLNPNRTTILRNSKTLINSEQRLPQTTVAN